MIDDTARGACVTGSARPAPQGGRFSPTLGSGAALNLVHQTAAKSRKAVMHYPATCAPVMAIIWYTSSTEQPRERSLAGFAKPCRIGPSAVAPPMRWAIL